MSSFTDPLDVLLLAKERGGIGLVQLQEEFTYRFEGDGTDITVPNGFITDLASIPRIARPFFCIAGKSAKPAILHDYLLHMDDKRATKVFNEALKVAQFSTIGRWIMVAFVFIWTFNDLH